MGECLPRGSVAAAKLIAIMTVLEILCDVRVLDSVVIVNHFHLVWKKGEKVVTEKSRDRSNIV